MDEYVWLLLLLGFWVFEIVGKALKRKAGGDADGEAGDPSIRDPRVARRQSSREITESARRAEEALGRWEADQAEVVTAPQPVPTRRPRGPARKQSAFEAIASMLVELPLEGDGPPAVPEPVSVPVVAKREERVHQPASQVPKAKLTAPPLVVRREPGGLRGLARLPELQRAIVLSEILGPPVSLARPREYWSA